jgi:hypothetical protein
VPNSGFIVVAAGWGQNLAIRAAWQPQPGDYNRDGTVNFLDYPAFAFSILGPFEEPEFFDWARLDFDEDSDIDLADFAAFQRAFGQP